MTPTLSNIAAYSIQLAVLVGAAMAVVSALRLRNPLASLRFWQAALAASLLLPLLQPPTGETRQMLASSAMFLSNSAPVTALAARGVDVAQGLTLAIAIGTVARLLWLGIGFIRLRAIVAHATPESSLESIAGELATALATRGALTITDEIDTPATVGFRRAMILLPRRVLQLPPAVQRAVIAHELVHVKRRDWLYTVAEELWCAMLWFHPAARIIAQRLSLARETVVDETTVRLTRDRRAYAEALLAFANPQPHLPGVTALIGRRHLSQRISLIAEEARMSRGRMLVSFATALFVSAVATASAISAFPMTAEAQPTRVYRPGKDAGITLPAVTREVKPAYTREAMQQKIQGSVFVEAVVLETGDVGDLQVIKSLDTEYGLDQQALLAIKQWKFRPGTKDRKAVAVLVTIQLTFTLR